jgi:hypothetical protein
MQHVTGDDVPGRGRGCGAGGSPLCDAIDSPIAVPVPGEPVSTGAAPVGAGSAAGSAVIDEPPGMF